MQFLYPNFLWALFTLSIPIIIHLFNFKRYKTVYFSNVAFLQNIQRQSRSKSTLKKLLLLFLRLLMIAALVLLFARPYLPNNPQTSVKPTNRVALYIDNSYSMEAEGSNGMLLEDAKIKALQIVGSYALDARFLLVDNTFNPLHMQWVTGEQVMSFISQIQATHVFRTINQVFDRINLALPQMDSTQAVHCFLLSDFQKSILPIAPELSPNLQVYIMPFKSNTNTNLLIDSVWFETPGHYKGKPEVLMVRIQNYGNDALSNAPLQLYLNDTLRNSINFSVEANSKTEVQIPFTQYRAGCKRIQLQLSDFPITFDNKFYLNYSINERNQLLIINDSEASNYFEALYEHDENIEAQVVSSQAIPYSQLRTFQLIILNGLKSISSGLINAIDEFILQGGQVLFIPANKELSGIYNKALKHWGGVSFESWVAQQGTIQIQDSKNSLFESSFNSEIKAARLPDYQGYYPLNKSTQFKVISILSAESGADLFVAADKGLGRIYISSLPLDTKITNFATHPLFVPLFYNLALQSNQHVTYFYWLRPGLKIQVKHSDYGGENYTLTQKEPPFSLVPKMIFSRGNINLYPETEVLNAGIYDLSGNDEIISRVSFNYDRQESLIDYYTEDELMPMLQSKAMHKVVVLDANSRQLSQEVADQSQGHDLSQYLLWLILGLLLTELAVIRYVY